MKLSDKVYNVLKWALCIVVPAFITLLTVLGQLYGFSTELIVGTVSAVATFLGAILGISCAGYTREAGDDGSR